MRSFAGPDKGLDEYTRLPFLTLGFPSQNQQKGSLFPPGVRGLTSPTRNSAHRLWQHFLRSRGEGGIRCFVEQRPQSPISRHLVSQSKPSFFASSDFWSGSLWFCASLLSKKLGSASPKLVAVRPLVATGGLGPLKSHAVRHRRNGAG